MLSRGSFIGLQWKWSRCVFTRIHRVSEWHIGSPAVYRWFVTDFVFSNCSKAAVIRLFFLRNCSPRKKAQLQSNWSVRVVFLSLSSSCLGCINAVDVRPSYESVHTTKMEREAVCRRWKTFLVSVIANDKRPMGWFSCWRNAENCPFHFNCGRVSPFWWQKNSKELGLVSSCGQLSFPNPCRPPVKSASGLSFWFLSLVCLVKESDRDRDHSFLFLEKNKIKK